MESIILVNYLGKKGGGSAYALEMTKALLNNNQKVVVVLSDEIENKEKWEKLKIDKLCYIKTYKNYFTFIVRLLFWGREKRKIKRELKNFNISSIYIPMEQPLTSKVNKIFRKKIILTVHDVDPHSGDNKVTAIIGNFLNRGLRKKADKVILLSNLFKKRYSEKYNYKMDDINVVRHGLFFEYDDSHKEEDTSNVSNQTNILFFGRISKYKGVDILLDAFYKIEQKYDVTLTIAGSGDIDDYRDRISKIKNMTLINRWISDDEIKDFFKTPNTILVVPYRDATQSGVISIANLFRVPVIASNTGGLVEQVKNNQTGLLFENENVEDLISKISTALNNKEKLDVFTKKAFDETSHLWDLGAQKIIELNQE